MPRIEIPERPYAERLVALVREHVPSAAAELAEGRPTRVGGRVMARIIRAAGDGAAVDPARDYVIHPDGEYEAA
ncbi:MAG TPA: hypothetical protein VNO79_11925 [Actinomycetota bacterium]|nr:hypothetical protein [Actinomycetota bacterium]